MKLPLENGFSTLCNFIKEIKRTAKDSGQAVSNLADATATSLQEVDSILSSMGEDIDTLTSSSFEIDEDGNLMPPEITN